MQIHQYRRYSIVGVSWVLTPSTFITAGDLKWPSSELAWILGCWHVTSWSGSQLSRQLWRSVLRGLLMSWILFQLSWYSSVQSLPFILSLSQFKSSLRSILLIILRETHPNIYSGAGKASKRLQQINWTSWVPFLDCWRESIVGYYV